MTSNLDILNGSIERFTYSNDENGYTVARFVPEGEREPLTIVGSLLGTNIGEPLRLEGVWTTHPKHGRQFKVERFTLSQPTTLEGLRRFLGSGLIKGVGPTTAERIVAHFGLETLDVIEQQPERLRQVPGIGAKRVAMIQRGWEEQQHIKQVMLFLQAHGVSTGLAVKIYKAYGKDALDVVRREPYRLARDVYGIGFLTADKIARALGMSMQDPARVEAGVRHVLSTFVDDGHVFARREPLMQQSVLALDVSAPLVGAALERLLLAGEVQCEDDAVYLTPFFRAEIGVTNRLTQLIATRATRLETFQSVNWDKAFAWLASRSQIRLTAQQQAAIQSALSEKVSILTGGPGTGKTTTVRGLIQLLKAKQHTFKLAAPTGRAAPLAGFRCANSPPSG